MKISEIYQNIWTGFVTDPRPPDFPASAVLCMDVGGRARGVACAATAAAAESRGLGLGRLRGEEGVHVVLRTRGKGLLGSAMRGQKCVVKTSALN